MHTEQERASRATADAEALLASGDAEAVQRGVESLARASEAGDARAMTLLAHFKASGVGDRADWDGAVDLLQQAAERGSGAALEELRVLARTREGAPRDLRARVDIRAWVAPRATQSVFDSPRVRTLASFLNAEECAWMIGLGKPRLQPAAVYDNSDAGSQVVRARTNSAGPLLFMHMDIVAVFIAARMANSIGLPSHFFEPPTVLHYEPGQEFRPHFDFLNPAVPGQAAQLQRGGQRLATFLVYLNDDYDGGETTFPRLNYSFKGQTGDALVFGNVDRDGGLDPRTMHAGAPPTRGVKWLLSQWVRDRPQ